MKKITLILSVLLLFSAQIFAEKTINILVVQGDGKTKTVAVDENQNHLTFFGPDVRSIKNIEGLENLKNLESLDFYNLTFFDMSFLKSCKNLNRLYISGCTITDFSFVESMPNLEELTFDFYIDETKNDIIKNKPIDLKQLKKLRKIYFIGLIKTNRETIKYGSIPRFQNVPSGCTLIMEDQGIEHLSENDVEILNQFSEVNLTANPVMKTDEIKQIKNIVTN